MLPRVLHRDSAMIKAAHLSAKATKELNHRHGKMQTKLRFLGRQLDGVDSALQPKEERQ